MEFNKSRMKTKPAVADMVCAHPLIQSKQRPLFQADNRQFRNKQTLPKMISNGTTHWLCHGFLR